MIVKGDLGFRREYGRRPTVLPNKRVEFRSHVIHRGDHPQRTEVVEYASDGFKIIVALSTELYETRYRVISDLDGIEIGKACWRGAGPSEAKHGCDRDSIQRRCSIDRSNVIRGGS